MRKFGEFSSLHANVEKCEACWIGRSKCRTDQPVNCKVISLIRSSIKILGVHYSNNREVAEDENFSELTKSMKTVISDYTNGGLKEIDMNCKLLSLKFSWIARLLDKSNFHPWKVIANEILRPVGGCGIFHTDLSLSSETRKQL